MTSVPDIRIAQDLQSWAPEAAELLLSIGQTTIQSNGRFLLALSGGSTPKLLYNQLTTSIYADRMDWRKTVFLFGDERGVPPDHPDSNFGLAQKALFTPLHIPPNAIHRMRAEERDLTRAALAYEETIRSVAKTSAPAWPRLDLILLGLGDDGHIASLFPGTAALNDRARLVVPNQSPKGVTSRLTMTLGVINQATVVLFLVTGASKASMVRAVLEPRTEAERTLPAALVKPTNGRLIWLLDRPAASALSPSIERPMVQGN